MNNYNVWYWMFDRTMNDGLTVSPRGQAIKEVEDLQFTIDPLRPFMNFEHRKLNINYFKKEMMWKLKGDRFDDSICQHAKMWASVKNDDGSFNSNYGQYWFGEQRGLYKAIEELRNDEHSRRSIIPMLNDSHIGPHVKDTVCTEAVSFRIRNGQLNMSVHMRSSDQIFGLGTDLPTFAFLYRLAYALLRLEYHTLSIGTMTVTAMSSHIYDRHWEMVNRILKDPKVAVCDMMPLANAAEAALLMSCEGMVSEKWGPLSAWLLSDAS